MKLRIIIADDERPARLFLKAILESFEDVEVIAEAENGSEAIELIEKMKPDLALLDLQMPEVSGLQVVKLLRRSSLPLVAFVTAFDEYAIKAFDVNAVDYLLKPVDRTRLRETLNRAHERLEQTDFRSKESAKLGAAAATLEASSPKTSFLERIPIKLRDEIILLPVSDAVSIVADGELLQITNQKKETFTINFRLKDLETRLDPRHFVRLSRGTMVNLEMISKISPMPGGTYQVILKNNQQFSASRLQSRILREQLLRL